MIIIIKTILTPLPQEGAAQFSVQIKLHFGGFWSQFESNKYHSHSHGHRNSNSNSHFCILDTTTSNALLYKVKILINNKLMHWQTFLI